MKTSFLIYGTTAAATALICLLVSAGTPAIETTNDSINWNGKYQAGDEKMLVISDYNPEKNSLHFKIHVIAKDACSGELEGDASVQSTGAVYSGADKKNTCTINFQFDGKSTIEIKETTCEDFHGTSCPFDGIYEK